MPQTGRTVIVSKERQTRLRKPSLSLLFPGLKPWATRLCPRRGELSSSPCDTGQGPGYWIASVSQSVADRVRRYIRNQVEHHRRVSFKDELIALLKKNGIPYDEKYLLG